MALVHPHTPFAALPDKPNQFYKLSSSSTVMAATAGANSSVSFFTDLFTFLSPKIHLSTQKNIHPPIKFATIVARATFHPPIHTIHTASIGELSCHRTKYKKNFFMSLLLLATSIILSPLPFLVNPTKNFISSYGGSYWARTSDLTNVNRTL